MDHLMTTEDSYAERRQLFKNIWETAMNIEDKDADIMNKPKVIKTLRLDEVDRYGVNKKKKLKLKNLRTVCNKILDFCDRQEADDLFYEQMNAEGQVPLEQNADTKPKKLKSARIKKKMKKSKSLYSPHKSPIPRVTLSERPDEFNAKFTAKSSRITSPAKIRQTVPIKTGTVNKTTKQKTTSITSRDVTSKIKKKSKSKKASPAPVSDSSGSTKQNHFYYVDMKHTQRPMSKPKRLLQVHKITNKLK